MTELDRRKAFIKAAHDVMKVWPGYAAYKLPSPDNRTDQCMQCDLRFSLARLVETWQDCRAGRATDEDFRLESSRWAVDRMRAADILNIGKPEGEYAVCKRMKAAVVKSRETCKFKTEAI